MQAEEMEVGLEVRFGKLRGEQRTGKVEKLNAKSAKVTLIAEDGEEEIWTVPYSLIYSMDAVATQPSNDVVEPNVEFVMGEQVSFGRPRGERHFGVIMKVNSKSLMIQSDDGRSWRVKPSFVERIDEVEEDTPEVEEEVVSAPVVIITSEIPVAETVAV